MLRSDLLWSREALRGRDQAGEVFLRSLSGRVIGIGRPGCPLAEAALSISPGRLSVEDESGLESVTTAVTGKELFCDVHVCLCTARGNIVEDDRLAEARSLCQADISRDHALENLASEVLPSICRDL